MRQRYNISKKKPAFDILSSFKDFKEKPSDFSLYEKESLLLPRSLDFSQIIEGVAIETPSTSFVGVRISLWAESYLSESKDIVLYG